MENYTIRKEEGKYRIRGINNLVDLQYGDLFVKNAKELSEIPRLYVAKYVDTIPTICGNKYYKNTALFIAKSKNKVREALMDGHEASIGSGAGRRVSSITQASMIENPEELLITKRIDAGVNGEALIWVSNDSSDYITVSGNLADKYLGQHKGGFKNTEQIAEVIFRKNPKYKLLEDALEDIVVDWVNEKRQNADTLEPYENMVLDTLTKQGY